MSDVHSSEQRSRNMAAIHGKNTKPELVVRSALHSLGYRFRLHGAGLPGKPDIVLAKYHLVIFVHGCFWHSHACRFGKVTPVTRAEFWAAKRAGTVERDRKKERELKAMGWTVIRIWECETKDPDELTKTLKRGMPVKI